MEKFDFPIALDSTMRAAFKSCNHKFMREYLQHLTPEGSNVHFIFGAAYARGLEVSRQCFYGHDMDLDEAIAIGLIALFEEYGFFEPPEGHAKTAERCALALLEYFHVWDPATDHIQPLRTAQGLATVEFSFALPIPGVLHPQSGDPLLYSGRFDMLGEMQNMTLVVDDKTTSSLGASWVNKWGLRGQLTGYVWGAQEYGYNAIGACLRGMSILKNSFGTAEVLEQRADWKIAQYVQQLARDARLMIERWEEGYWDQDFADACEAYGGCPFTRLCTSHNPEEWIDTYYTRRVWDPLRAKAVNPTDQIRNAPLTFAT